MARIVEANITDAQLEQLVCKHRDLAGAAERHIERPANVQLYRDTQNGWADLFQELLDRRRAQPGRV